MSIKGLTLFQKCHRGDILDDYCESVPAEMHYGSATWGLILLMSLQCLAVSLTTFLSSEVVVLLFLKLWSFSVKQVFWISTRAILSNTTLYFLWQYFRIRVNDFWVDSFVWFSCFQRISHWLWWGQYRHDMGLRYGLSMGFMMALSEIAPVWALHWSVNWFHVGPI